MTTRITLEPAYVLHRRPYRNTSLIVELFSQHYGRVSVVAKSARGFKSRYRGALDLFSPLLVSWVGQRELKTLGNIELHDSPLMLEQSALLCGFYMNELLMRLLQRDDPYPDLFIFYQQTLRQLLQRNSLSLLLRQFEKKLLEELGYGLPLHREFQSGLPIDPNAYYEYIPDQGFLRSEKKVPDAFVFLGHSLIALNTGHFHEEKTLQDIKRLMRMAIACHLGSKPLRSRELLR